MREIRNADRFCSKACILFLTLCAGDKFNLIGALCCVWCIAANVALMSSSCTLRSDKASYADNTNPFWVSGTLRAAQTWQDGSSLFLAGFLKVSRTGQWYMRRSFIVLINILYTYASILLCFYVSIIYLSVCLSYYLSIYLSIIHLFVSLSACLFIRAPIHLTT